MSDPRKQLYGIISGAVVDVVKTHPDFFRKPGLKWARHSIAKRATGQIMGLVVKAAKGGDAAASSADKDSGTDQTARPASQGGGVVTAEATGGTRFCPPAPHCRIGRIKAKPIPGRTFAARKAIEARYRVHADLARGL